VGHGFVHDVDDAGARDETEARDAGLFLCVQNRAVISLKPEAIRAIGGGKLS
jgi:hypothetical protein